MPRSCSALSICRYLARADSSHWPSWGSMRLHSTESRSAFTPRDFATSKASSALRHQSHAKPTRSLYLIRPRCSHAAHWLFEFPPSTWCEDVATPHAKSAGKTRVGLRGPVSILELDSRPSAASIRDHVGNNCRSMSSTWSSGTYLRFLSALCCGSGGSSCEYSRLRFQTCGSSLFCSVDSLQHKELVHESLQAGRTWLSRIARTYP